MEICSIAHCLSRRRPPVQWYNVDDLSKAVIHDQAHDWNRGNPTFDHGRRELKPNRMCSTFFSFKKIWQHFL